MLQDNSHTVYQDKILMDINNVNEFYLLLDNRILHATKLHLIASRYLLASVYQRRVNGSECNVNTRVNLYRARLHVTARSVSGILPPKAPH